MRTLLLLISCSVVVGCSEGSRAGQSSSETDTGVNLETDSETSTGDTDTNDEPSCDELCNETCSQQVDACDNPLIGACTSDDVCVCESDWGCFDCEQEVCDAWEQCTIEWGCSVCWTSTEVPWDPALDCTLDLSTVEPILIPYIGVTIGDEMVSSTDTCATMPDGMSWHFPEMHLQLCADACTAFEQVGWLEVYIGCVAGFENPPAAITATSN